MITWLLRRWSVRHPQAAWIVQAVILVAGTVALVGIALWDLQSGKSWLRPALALAALTLIAVYLASTGLRRRV